MIIKKRHYFIVFIVLITIVFIDSRPAFAYVGPGAGFALLSSLLAIFVSFLLAFFSLLTLPIRFVIRILKKQKIRLRAPLDKVVILGFDGLDPDLYEKFVAKGELPNFKKLQKKGTFKRLGTSFPSLSPVAWSTFATGANPARHNIYDFLTRNPKTYLPELSSAKIGDAKKSLKIGSYEIPLGKPVIQFLRKSKSFWTILGEHGVFSHIIRVPITFPPEKFRGAMLSAMCTPDLQGTQGTFSYYTTESLKNTDYTGGTRLPLTKNKKGYAGELVGPVNSLKKNRAPMKLPFLLSFDAENKKVKISFQGKSHTLNVKEFSPWIQVTFKAGLGVQVQGVCQFYIKQIEPHVQLYVSPINIDPGKPALPISYPFYYSIYLSKLFGTFGSLGLLEDTWALNENVLDDHAFLDQVYLFHEEREKQFFHALRKTQKGVCACVFDCTDRIQHTFFRYIVKDHPADDGKGSEKSKNAILDVYRKADDLLGRTMKQISDNTLLFVLSDHGFKSFARGININSWLHQNGYLTLKNGNFNAQYLQNVDWSKTKAYATGLAGIYLNIRGRESKGVVESGKEATKLKKEIIQKLTGLKDPKTKKEAIHQVYDTQDIYSGPYVQQAPDLIVGYHEGYRISWDGSLGKTTQNIFQDNTKCWSGDHGIDPLLVPGVLFCNFPIKDENPKIMDMAPTILTLFDVPVPKFMDGKPLQIVTPKN